MSNRKGGRYDSGGNWWAPYSEPSRWRRFWSTVATWLLGLALLAGFVAIEYWHLTRSGERCDETQYTCSVDPQR